MDEQPIPMRRAHTAALVLVAVGCLTPVVARAQEPDSKLKGLSDAEVAKCAPSPWSCGVGEWDVGDELATRWSVPTLMRRYDQAGEDERRVLLLALHRKNDDEAKQIMQRAAFGGHADPDSRYYALSYLVKRCDKRALRALSASQGLRQFYPEAPSFHSLGEMQRYFRARVKSARGANHREER